LVELSLQIHDPVAAEGRDWHSGFRVERNQMVAGRNAQDAFVSFTVSPVCDSAAGTLTRSDLATLTFIHPPHPQCFAGAWIDCHDRAPHSSLGVHDAVDDQRGHLHVVVRSHTEIVGLEPPGNPQVPGVLLIDLIKGRVLGASWFTCVGTPFSIPRPVLA
jgi:hypothetical protein